MTTNVTLYPELEPYAQAWLDVSGGHSIYFEQCGNPHGHPVVFLHGGPGSGCNPAQRRFFDPAYYRIVLLDQRGCGRSKPPGCIEENTTRHLIADIEHLRMHLGIGRWLVFGGSWGSTLALAYAAAHSPAVERMILRGIFLARQSELDWFLYEIRHFFPEAWGRLTDSLRPEERGDILQAYYHRVFSGEVDAARTWNDFESSIMSLRPQAASNIVPSEALTMARARVQLHYLHNGCFLAEHPLLTQVERFRSIPTTIIQGRYDMVCPPSTADELHRTWPEAEYVIVPDAGHSAMEPGVIAALIAATESFKQHE